MPYPNFHSARLHNPSQYRRPRYGHMRSGLDSMFGFTPGGNSPESQAYRFNRNTFTPDRAQDWLEGKGLHPLTFEQAALRQLRGQM